MFKISEYNVLAKIYLGMISALAVAAAVYSAFESVSYSITEWLCLAIVLSIGLIAGRYQIPIPRTSVHFSVREPLIFWSILWLGVGGGVLVALLSEIGNYRTRVKNIERWVAPTSAISIGAFVAANLFYLLVNRGFGFIEYPMADTTVKPLWLLGSLLLLGLVYGFLCWYLYSVSRKLDGYLGVSKLWKANLLWTIAACLLGAVVVFGFHQLILFFGLLFGILVLPITLIAHLSYRFHRQMLVQKTREIREASRVHVATVEALATAIDARDQVGRGHVTRAQIFAVGIGKILNLPVDEIQALRTGALLHDIGKLAIPDHILNKPGRLTPGEKEKMKIHPLVGASILEGVNFPYPVIQTIRHHHEFWDGTGYPEGMEKEEIPLTARILAVADAYDTLRGARPYRASVSREDARRFMISAAGTQFDPRIVDVFMRNLTRLEEKVGQRNLAYDLDDKSFVTEGEATKSMSFVEQIKRANQEVFTLYELARVFSSSLNLDETLSLFVKKIIDLVPLDTCVVYLLDQTESVAIARYAEGKYSDSLKNRKIKVGQGATGYTLKKRQSVYHINPGLDFAPYEMEFVKEYTSMASLPLIANERLIGAVSLYSCSLDAYEDEHMRLLETLSRIASDAIATSLKLAETETRAMTDPMTALPNARGLQTQFEKEIARARRNGSSFQVLMLDLDGFKAVNDTFGHKVGDRLLKDVAAVMSKQLRDYDFLARYAGDEFVAIIPETTHEAVQELCQRMGEAVKNYKLDAGGGGIANVGVSLGAAAYPNAGDTLDQLIIAADKAMYAVKGRRKRQKLKEIEDRQKLEKTKSRSQIKRGSQVIQPTDETVEETLVENETALIVELDETHVVSDRAS